MTASPARPRTIRAATGTAAASPGPRAPSAPSWTNPRYTGRQVWNRQRKDEVLLDVNDVALGHTTKMRWNDGGQWIYSEQGRPPAADRAPTPSAEAQQMLAARSGRASTSRTAPATPYALRGLLFCGICDRRMQGSWNNAAPYYRCIFPTEYARPTRVRTPATSPCARTPSSARLDRWLAGKFDARHLAADHRRAARRRRRRPHRPLALTAGPAPRSPSATAS